MPELMSDFILMAVSFFTFFGIVTLICGYQKP